MAQITIREVANAPEGAPNATVSFDHGPEHSITITDPFDSNDEFELAWYFEKHLEKPYLNAIRAKNAAASIQAYGEALFAQVIDGTPLRRTTIRCAASAVRLSRSRLLGRRISTACIGKRSKISACRAHLPSKRPWCARTSSPRRCARACALRRPSTCW